MNEEEKYKEAQKVVRRYEQQVKQSPVNCWAYNINDKMLVKLKDEGFRYWLEDYKHLPEKFRPTIDELRAKAGKEGYIEFQAWEFLRLFGETISIGSQSIFETTVRFFKDEMKPCR